MRVRLTIGLAIAAAAVPAQAQNPATIAAAKQAGIIGERYDGYVAFVTTPTAEVRRQVNAVNLLRRNLYIQLGARRRVTAALVGVATGCELLERIRTGEMYMLKDGVWRKRLTEQPIAKPSYCGG